MHWERIVEQHAAMLLRAAYHLLHDHGEAEDVVQEVLLEAYLKHSRDGTTPGGGLLRRMTLLRSVDRLRRRRRGESICEIVDEEGGGEPSREIVEAEQSEQLRRAIGRLPPQQGKCFVLRYLEGLDHAQIGEALKMSRSAVSSALHRARESLRAALRARIPMEDRP